MTRKEKAISIIKNELACVKNVDCERAECRNCSLVMPEHDVIEALNMAIKALEQEPCEDWCDVPSDEMTLEQARQAVKDLRKKLVEHLDQGSCIDAISRQAVLDKKELIELEDGQSFYCISPEDVETLPPVNPQMTEQWNELKETIIEMRDNDGTGTQQEACKFLANLMDVLEKQMQEPKTGHWVSEAIQGEIDGQIVKGFICSECGAISVFRMTGGKIVNGDLCPNCGCAMVEPQESEE